MVVCDWWTALQGLICSDGHSPVGGMMWTRWQKRPRGGRGGAGWQPALRNHRTREGWLLILTVLAHGKLKQIIILKLIEGTSPRKGAKAQSVFLNNTLPHCYSTRTGGRWGRVGNPPYGTTGTREGWLLILTVLTHGKLKPILYFKIDWGNHPTQRRKGAKCFFK